MDLAGPGPALRKRPLAFLRSPWPWRSAGWCAQNAVAGLVMFGMGSAVVAPVGTRTWLLNTASGAMLDAFMVVLFMLVAIPVAAWQRQAVRIAGWPEVISWYPVSLGPAAPWTSRFAHWAKGILRGGAIFRDTVYCILLLPLAALALTFTLIVPFALVFVVASILYMSEPITDPWSYYTALAVTVLLLCVSPWVWALLAIAGPRLAEWTMGIGHDRALAMAAAQQASRRRLSGAFDAERQRIERDLHDGAQQRILAQTLTLGLAVEELRALGSPAAPALSLVEKARAENREILAELRDLVRAIHPQTLTDHGLTAALAEVVSRFPLKVTMTADYPADANERPDSLVESTAYFVVLEALSNAAKHSGCTDIAVRIRLARDQLHILVRDDGVGGADLIPGGGLAGLADRVEAVGGVFLVSSPQGGPTIVRADIPCDPPTLPLDRILEDPHA